MKFVIKVEVTDPRARTLEFGAQKTMYDGKTIWVNDRVFVFDSENEGGKGLLLRATVTSAEATPKRRGVARQTPRLSVIVRRSAFARRALGREALKRFSRWNDGRPETELNFKLYRQATNKIAGISAAAAAFLDTFF